MTLIFIYSERSIRELREEKLEAIKKKATSYEEELNREKQSTKTWTENLRRVRSQNDMHKAVPQEPLVPQCGKSEKLGAIKKKAKSFAEELEHDKESTKTWKENLCRVRLQNDLHKAVLQPPLVPQSGC